MTAYNHPFFRAANKSNYACVSNHYYYRPAGGDTYLSTRHESSTPRLHIILKTHLE